MWHWTVGLEASASGPLSRFEGLGPWTRKSFPSKKSIKAGSCVSGCARRMSQPPPPHTPTPPHHSILHLPSVLLLFDIKKLGQLSRESKRAKASSAFTLRQLPLITFQKWALLCSHGLSHQLQTTSQRFPGTECICELNGSLKSTPGLPEKITVKEIKVKNRQRRSMSEHARIGINLRLIGCGLQFQDFFLYADSLQIINVAHEPKQVSVNQSSLFLSLHTWLLFLCYSHYTFCLFQHNLLCSASVFLLWESLTVFVWKSSHSSVATK